MASSVEDVSSVCSFPAIGRRATYFVTLGENYATMPASHGRALRCALGTRGSELNAGEYKQ